ncbi:MAG: hypothetical protein M3153_06595 [Chloroflexota bacterium]|nr:hypothetical protein [Chloroflexota bacterium]
MTTTHRRLAVAINVGLRAALLVFLADAIVYADDPRFAGKAIGSRGSVILPLSLLLPVLYLTWRRGQAYPFWMDNLYLSIFALDLGGNSFDLYNTYRHFDLIPHGHGTGSVTVLLGWLLRQPVLSAIGLATVLHIGLEAQEYYSDVLFGLANVRGTWDVVNDLVVGILGSVAYAAVYVWLVRRRDVARAA